MHNIFLFDTVNKIRVSVRLRLVGQEEGEGMNEG